jgi:hypothetical protein
MDAFDLVGLIWPFVITLGFNLGLMLVLKKHDTAHEQHIFTFFIVGIVIFFLCYSLKSFDLNLGMAIGLFAIFGIIRYRTEALSPQVISYLFATIGISAINALGGGVMGWTELLIVNSLVLLCIFLAERFFLNWNDKSGTPVQKVAPQPKAVELQKCNLVLPLEGEPLKVRIQQSVESLQNELGIQVKSYRIARVDHSLNTVQIQLMYED